MSLVDHFLPAYTFNRGRTLGLLDTIEKEPAPLDVLGWRPGPGRAHIAWQLLHVAVTEAIFASERLAPHKTPVLAELWPRFRGGSTPDDVIPSPAEIRAALEVGRAALIETLADYGDDRLDEIPPPLAARKLTVRDVLHILGWHEAHHQGQAHITLNLFKSQRG